MAACIPHKIGFTPHDAVDGLTRSGANSTDGEGLRRWFRHAVEAFGFVLTTMSVVVGLIRAVHFTLRIGCT